VAADRNREKDGAQAFYASVQDSMLNGEIQRGPVGAGLAASGRYYAGFRSAPNPKGPPSLRTQPFMGR